MYKVKAFLDHKRVDAFQRITIMNEEQQRCKWLMADDVGAGERFENLCGLSAQEAANTYVTSRYVTYLRNRASNHETILQMEWIGKSMNVHYSSDGQKRYNKINFTVSTPVLAQSDPCNAPTYVGPSLARPISCTAQWIA